MKIRNMKVDGFKVETIPIIYYKNTSLEKAVDRLFIEADRAYRDGANILILSDRGVDDNMWQFLPCLPYLHCSSIW